MLNCHISRTHKRLTKVVETMGDVLWSDFRVFMGTFLHLWVVLRIDSIGELMLRYGCHVELAHHIVVNETNHALEKSQLNFHRIGGDDYTKQWI
jgi:hypothetical protein